MPEFTVELFSDAVILASIQKATVFMSDGAFPSASQTEMLSALATAHLLVVDDPNAFAGSTSGGAGSSQNGNILSVKVGNVQMDYAAAPVKTAGQYFWMKTKYGQTLVAMSKVLVPTAVLQQGSYRRVYRGNMANRLI